MLSQKRNLAVISLVLGLILVSGSWAYPSVREAPTFILYTLEGEEIEFHPSELTFLYFLSPECGECLYPLLSLHQSLKEQENTARVTLLTICSDCNWREVKSLKETLPPEIEVYFGNHLRALWGAWETPSLFLVNSQNKVVGKWEGEIDAETLLANLPQPQNNKKSEKKSTSCGQGLCY
ncbi:MAG: hypothetical protein PWP57_1322 [Candidatus Atribacteria bacterium]|nr:hypothetical protein [Candidatus Atribacteria bacterium]